MVEACDRTGLSIDEMVVEIDLMANEDGVIPALQTPPIFKIAPIRITSKALEYLSPSDLGAAVDAFRSDIRYHDIEGLSKLFSPNDCRYFVAQLV
ncbi:unnamed protein product, partial [Cylindrotheca closterium]